MALSIHKVDFQVISIKLPMKAKILIILFVLCSQSAAFSQTQSRKESFRSVKLSKAAYEANFGSSRKLKLRNVVLKDIKDLPNDWIYLFHLKDAKTGFELKTGFEVGKGANAGFVLCTDATVGKSLLEQKDEWLNQDVNVYLIGQDVGVSPLKNVGFVTKIELLDSKGIVIKTIP